MISQDQLVQLIIQTYNGTDSEQIRHAEEELHLQYQYPEFPSLILNLISKSSSQHPSICKASIIQLREYLNTNHQFLVENGINLLLQISSILPLELLPVLEIIANSICNFYAKNDINLLNSFQSLLSSNSPISSFILLDSYFCTNKTISKDNLQIIYQIIQTEFQMLQQIISNSPSDPKTAPYLHYFSTSCVLHFINYASTPEQIMPYYIFAIQVIQSNYTSNLFDIPSDYLDIIFNCISLYPDSFNSIPFMDCATVYFQNSPSLIGLSQFYQIMQLFLTNEKSFSELIQNLQQTIQMFFYPIFQISEEDQLDFENDPLQFLESVFPSIQEAETPRSSAASCLYESSKINQEIIPKIAFTLMVQILKDGSNLNIWQIFSAILFFSTCSQFYIDESAEFAQFLQQVISTNLQSGNIIMTASSFIFLANYPFKYAPQLINDHQYILASIHSLAANGSNPLICYLSSCASGHLLSLINSEYSDQTPTLEIQPEVISSSIQNIFVCSHQMPTNRIAQAVSSFISYFITTNGNIFRQFAGQTINTLMQLLIQYMHDDNTEARQSATLFSDTIHSLCMSIGDSSQDVFDFVLSQVDLMIEDQLGSDFLEEILPLIDGCVKGSSTTVTQQIVSIPPKLLLLLQVDGGTFEAMQISQIYKSFVLKFSSQMNDQQGAGVSSLINPIIQMIQLLINDVEDLSDEEMEAITTFIQIMFIYIPNFIQNNSIEFAFDFNQFIGQWIHPLISVESPQAADSIAAMIQFSPAIALNNDEIPIFSCWIENARPKAFLSSAMSFLMNSNEISNQMKQQILEKAHQAISNLSSDDYENDENEEFFNMETINAFFGQTQSQ